MAITDKFNNTRTTVNPVVTTVSNSRAIGGSSLSCTDLTGWPTTVHYITYKKTATGAIDKETQCDWKGIVSGSTIGSVTLKNGSDAGNDIGDFVEMAPTAAWGKDLIDGLAQEHNVTDGTHAAVTATSLVTTGAVTAGNGFTLSAGTMTAPTASLSGLGGAWATWSPTLTNITKGNGTEVARYSQVGKRVRFYYSLTFGSTTSISTATSKVTLPVTAASNITQYSNLGQITMFDSSAGTSYHGPFILDTTTVGIFNVIKTDVTYAFGVDVITTVPMTWATGDRLTVSGEYEAG